MREWLGPLSALLAAALPFTTAGSATPEPLYGGWHSSRIGGGGFIQNVVLCPSDPNLAYAYVDVGGLFRSEDRGRSWRMLHRAFPVPGLAQYSVRGVSVDPRDANCVLVAAGCQWAPAAGLFLTKDGGVSWTAVIPHVQFYGNEKFRAAGFILSRNPLNPDEILAATGGDGIWRSRDNGATWRNLGLENILPVDLVCDRWSGRRLWLSAQAQRFANRDPLAGGFYRSEDAGETWTKLTDEAPHELVQDPKRAEVLYAIFKGTDIRRSTDAGITWEQFEPGLPARETMERKGPNLLNALATGPDFLLTASSAGSIWKLTLPDGAWSLVKPEGIRENYAGKPWFGRIRPGAYRRFGSALGSFTIDPADSARWFFTDWYGIYQTTDAGRNWELSMDGVEATVIHCLAPAPHDPSRIYLGMGDNGYFYSTDGAETYEQPAMPPAGNIKSIALPSRRPNRIYAAGNRTPGVWVSDQVYISDDAGITWKKSPMAGYPDAAKHHCNTIVASPIDPDLVYLTVSQPVGENGGGVYMSDDGGMHWRWNGAGLPLGEPFFSNEIWCAGPELAVGAENALVALSPGRKGVYYWNAAAARWNRAETPFSDPKTVVAAQRDFYVADETLGLLKSEDGGRSWMKIYSGSVRHTAVDPADPTRLAIGTSNGILMSFDAGKTWAMLDQNLPYRHYPIPAIAGDRLLAGTTGNGAFWLPLDSHASRNKKASEANAEKVTKR